MPKTSSISALNLCIVTIKSTYAVVKEDEIKFFRIAIQGM